VVWESAEDRAPSAGAAQWGLKNGFGSRNGLAAIKSLLEYHCQRKNDNAGRAPVLTSFKLSTFAATCQFFTRLSRFRKCPCLKRRAP